MSIPIHCTLFLTPLAAALLLSSFCIRAPPAAASPCPPSFSPAAYPSPPSPSCRLLSSPLCASWLPPNFTNPMDITLPLLNRCSLYLYTNLSSSSPFTINFTDELLVGCPPRLAFALLRSLPPFMELIFDFSFRDSCAAAAERQPLLLAVSESQEPRIQTPTNSSCKEPSPDYSNWKESRFNYSVSLTYNTSSAALHVQAKVNYGGGFEINQTFVFNTTDLQLDVDDANYRGQDDNIGLVVGYVTGGEATISVTGGEATINIITIKDAPSPTDYKPYNFSDPLPLHENNSKSSHVKVVVWVVVGVSMVAFVVGLMILALSLKKQYRRRPRPLVSASHLAGGPIGPPSTTRAPFPHPHLESSATPMMTTLCLSPPYHTDNFQISGTASWLKQPAAR